MQLFAGANPRRLHAQPLAQLLTVAVDALVRPVAGDAGVELAVADVALEAVLVIDLPLAEHLHGGEGGALPGFRAQNVYAVTH